MILGDATLGTESDASSEPGGGATPDGGGIKAHDAAASPFVNLVQVDVRSILVNNVVATTQPEDAGAALQWADGYFGQHDFATQSLVDVLAPDAGLRGLPDNATFPGDGVNVPGAQLWWSDGANELNSVLLQNDQVDAGIPSVLTFSVPPVKYQQVQVYVTGTHGQNGVASNISATLTYAGETTSTETFLVPAWDAQLADVDAGAGEFTLASGLAPFNQGTGALETGFSLSIYAVDLNPDSSKTLLGVTLLDTGGDPSQLAFETVVFFGATGW